jgi:nitroimidazol reductase NimA-like FMN-containing flavoprotein (pyridoxamine 5'-phosphate oxidase superfamily)
LGLDGSDKTHLLSYCCSWKQAGARLRCGVPMVRSSFVTSALPWVSNVALLGLVLWKERRWLQSLALSIFSKCIYRRSPIKKSGSLSGYLNEDYVPPLPQPIAIALERSCLCFLATSVSESPHLSLMRFTYCASLENPQDEVLVMTTRRDTKKYEMLGSNRQVALLVHEFSNDGAQDESTNYATVEGRSRYSITLNGLAQEATGELAEKYRQLHLLRNAGYKQFIEGDDIAVITVSLTGARVCDVHDSVRHYSRLGSPSQPLAWEEVTTST